MTSEASIFAYQYDQFGRKTGLIYPNGAQAKYIYDSRDRLIRIEHQAKNGEISSFEYSFDQVGNVIKIVQDGNKIWEYSYDKLYRLKRESLKDIYYIEYEYDAFGNRLRQNHNGSITTYSYNANDQLLEEQSPEAVYTYNYDANGNMIRKSGLGENWEYFWNYDNKLIQVKKNGQNVGSFDYNYNGDRIKKITAQGEIKYLVDSNNLTGYSQVLRESVNGDDQVNYIYADDLYAKNSNGVINYYHYDRLGSVRKLSDVQGNFSDGYDYYAFGKIQATQGDTQNNYLYTGEQYEEMIDSYYLRARYYNLFWGRFISMDKTEHHEYSPQNYNNYMYVNNRPINMVDPLGLYGLGDVIATVGIIHILSTMAVGPSIQYLKYHYGKREICPVTGVCDCPMGTWSGMGFGYSGKLKFGQFDVGISLYRYAMTCWGNNQHIGIAIGCITGNLNLGDILEDDIVAKIMNVLTFFELDFFSGNYCYSQCKHKLRGDARQLGYGVNAIPRIGQLPFLGVIAGGAAIGIEHNMGGHPTVCSSMGFPLSFNLNEAFVSGGFCRAILLDPRFSIWDFDSGEIFRAILKNKDILYD